MCVADHPSRFIPQWQQETSKPRDAVSMQAQARGLLKLYNFAYSTLTRCKGPAQLLELDAILLKTLIRRPGPHPRRSDSLTRLATALIAKFDRTSQLRGLSDGFLLRLETLGRWRDNFERTTGSLDQLSQPHTTDSAKFEAFEPDNSGENNTAPQPSHPSQSHLYRPLRRLAAALETRFGLSGQLKDLHEAISLYRVALQPLDAADSSRPDVLHSLAGALKTRSDWTGRRLDLDEAVLLNREALEMLPPPHIDRAYAINRLAVALHRRFTVANRDEDLEAAIQLFTETLQLPVSLHPDRSLTLTNYASTLITGYKTGSSDALENAIPMIREALELQPAPHPNMLHSLADAIYQRYEDTEQPADRDEVASLAQKAITLTREALKRLPPHHPHRSIMSDSLAKNSLLRFQVLDDFSCLSDALLASQDSIGLLTERHPARCRYYMRLGQIFQEMYGFTQKSGYLEDSMAAYRAATRCESASALGRFNASSEWIHATSMADGSRHHSALEAYQTAIELRVLLAPLDLDIRSRRFALRGSEDVVASAPTYAAISGRLDKAVEFLEQGRAVLFSQALQLRFSTDKIHPVAPELGQKLDALSRALEQGSQRDAWKIESDISTKVIAVEQEAMRYHRLNEDWLATVEEVRKLDGFEEFLRPKSFTTLQRAALHGPVIMLIDPGLYTEEDSFHALIMTSSGVQHVPLPLMTLEHVNKLVELVQTVVLPDYDDEVITKDHLARLNRLLGSVKLSKGQTRASLATSDSLDRGTQRASKICANADEIFLSVLAVLWTRVVEPVIRFLALGKSDSPPRLWWCPTGNLALLPIHAAGIYSLDRSDYVSEYVVSSYIPTINTLLSPPAPTASQLKMMVVIQPQTPGYALLPCTREELKKIKQHVQLDECLITLGTPEAPALAEQVVSHFMDISIVHFACHGERGEDSPLENAFVLEHAQKLKVSRIMELPLPNAMLAYLSACHAASSDEQSPDETINLATSLLFAGFRGSIATMWSIADVDGPKVADSVYGYLFRSNHNMGTLPDTSEAARALHIAVAKLRAENCPFKRWVPFIHLGL